MKGFFFGAGDGNRTRLTGLGSPRTTDVLHPRILLLYHIMHLLANKKILLRFETKIFYMLGIKIDILRQHNI